MTNNNIVIVKCAKGFVQSNIPFILQHLSLRLTSDSEGRAMERAPSRVPFRVYVAALQRVATNDAALVLATDERQRRQSKRSQHSKTRRLRRKMGTGGKEWLV